MTDWKLPWTGGCRCGAVRFTVTAAPLISMACHCTGCQRMTASAFSLSLALPEAGFSVTKGEPVLGGLRQQTRHYFCPDCKSWVYTRPADPPGLVNLRATMLDEAAWFVPHVEFFTAEKLPWATTGARHSYATAPEPSEFGPLLAEYAAERARP